MLNLQPHRTDENRMLVLKGYVLYDQKKFPHSIECFEKVFDSAKNLQPGDLIDPLLDALKGLILSNMSLRNFAKALKYCEEFPDLSNLGGNRNEIIKIWHGYCLLGEKNFEQALDKFKSVIESNKSNLSAMYGMGIANIFLGNGDDYNNCFNSIIDSNYKKDNKNDLFYVAMSLSNLDKDSIAINYFKELLKIDHSDSEILIGIGTSLLKLGKLDESLHYLEQALELDKDDLYATTIVGSVYMELEDFEKAEQKFNYVLKKIIHTLKPSCKSRYY